MNGKLKINCSDIYPFKTKFHSLSSIFKIKPLSKKIFLRLLILPKYLIFIFALFLSNSLTLKSLTKFIFSIFFIIWAIFFTSLVIISSDNISDEILSTYKTKECLIIDNYNNDISEKILYSIINQAYQDNKYLIISSTISIKKFKIKLLDLKSRFSSFIDIGIELPTDDLIRVILTKNFSDKQIQVSQKNIEYILKNIERSYEKINTFSNSIDSLSLTKAQPIKLNLIKKVLNEIRVQ